MPQFKTIDYSLVNYEAVRNFHAINRAGLLSIEYRYTLCCVWPLQLAFDDFHLWRKAKKIIANCKWTVGQVTNVLNYFFDNTLNRIFITQQRIENVFVPVINYESAVFASEISDESTVLAPGINDFGVTLAHVTINVPTEVYSDAIIMSQLISVVEQIKITGFSYSIAEI